MILLRKAYRGHYIEIRPEARVLTARGHQALTAQAWLDGTAITPPLICETSGHLQALLIQVTDRIDQQEPHVAPASR